MLPVVPHGLHGLLSLSAGLGLLLVVGGWAPPTGARVEAPEPPEPRREGSGAGRGEANIRQSDAPGPHDPFADPPPRDPDAAPFSRPPNNQLGQWSTDRQAPLTRGFDDDHHAQLSLIPTYAALHVPFIGRGSTPLRGGGMALELDVRLLRWLFIRVRGSHTLHPVFEETSFDEDSGETSLRANAGLVQTTDTAVAIVYALDIGRFVPRVDIGAGLLFVRSPVAAQPGQWGAACREGNVCDLGLRCSSEAVCRAAPSPEVHAGIGLDVLLGRRWALGVAVRYYALLQALSNLPIYLHGSVRLSVRF
jgi:hypothetical protein